MKMRVNVLFFSFVLMLATTVASAQDWEFKREKEGIKVWVRPVIGSGMRAFKAETTFNVPMAACVALLRDIDRFTELFPDCISTKRIAQNDTAQIHHITMDAPWPVNDRDGVFKFKYLKGENGAMRVTSTIVLGHEPEKAGVVRLKKGYGEWNFQPLDPKRTKLVYTFHAEPGGSVPEWLADKAVTDTPIGVLKNFQRMVGESKYSSAQLPHLLR